MSVTKIKYRRRVFMKDKVPIQKIGQGIQCKVRFKNWGKLN